MDFKLGLELEFFFYNWWVDKGEIKSFIAFVHVKPLNQIGLALTIKNYMEISGKNKKEGFEQTKPRNFEFLYQKKRNPNKTKAFSP